MHSDRIGNTIESCGHASDKMGVGAMEMAEMAEMAETSRNGEGTEWKQAEVTLNGK